jgi:rRNA-processing protein FCF1|tara:strand:+ start:996 stop:1484 length:489 start_codon:yes stop_codon:yes gene_type:complete
MPVITDANVLIDYIESDISMLALYSDKIEQVIIPSVIVDEVEQLSLDDCESHGFLVIEEELEVLSNAANFHHGPLSFEDKVCLYLAKSLESATCITNEKALHKFCEKDNIPVKRGLKLLIELVEADHLEAEEAIKVVYMIHNVNPHHIHQGVVDEFIRLITG